MWRIVSWLAVLLAACAGPPVADPPTDPAAPSSSQLLAEIGQAFWQYELDEQILSRMWQGVPTTHKELPDYRRGVWHGGYTEGWGEYASSMLAADMGLYQDPYDLYGRLSDDNFYAARLVVDTGMNVLGWSRARAMELMLENTLESRISSAMIRGRVSGRRRPRD